MELSKQCCRLLLGGLAALLVTVGASGCGTGRYPVRGTVTYEDGSPMTEGSVIGNMTDGTKCASVQGRIESNGRFSWGTESPGDGAKPGKYAVAVTPRGLSDDELSKGMVPAVDAKLSNPQTSGIEFEVKPTTNELNIKVTRPKRSRS